MKAEPKSRTTPWSASGRQQSAISNQQSTISNQRSAVEIQRSKYRGRSDPVRNTLTSLESAALVELYVGPRSGPRLWESTFESTLVPVGFQRSGTLDMARILPSLIALGLSNLTECAWSLAHEKKPAVPCLILAARNRRWSKYYSSCRAAVSLRDPRRRRFPP
jgi:hypothetical protein